MKFILGILLTFSAMTLGLCWLIVEFISLIFLVPLTVLIRAKTKLLEDHDVGK